MIVHCVSKVTSYHDFQDHQFSQVKTAVLNRFSSKMKPSVFDDL